MSVSSYWAASVCFDATILTGQRAMNSPQTSNTTICAGKYKETIVWQTDWNWRDILVLFHCALVCDSTRVGVSLINFYTPDLPTPITFTRLHTRTSPSPCSSPLHPPPLVPPRTCMPKTSTDRTSKSPHPTPYWYPYTSRATSHHV